ncbi:MAG: sensor histidine kinase [Planctomycetota bacterium]|nr:MAG: sensor histidine kinase [Planctomycetota bacterium]
MLAMSSLRVNNTRSTTSPSAAYRSCCRSSPVPLATWCHLQRRVAPSPEGDTTRPHRPATGQRPSRGAIGSVVRRAKPAYTRSPRRQRPQEPGGAQRRGVEGGEGMGTDWQRLAQRLVRGLDHDLRNPLNAIALALQLIERQLRRPAGPDPEQILRSVRGAGKEIERCRDVLAEASALIRQPEPSLEETDLVSVLRPLCDTLGSLPGRPALRLVAPTEPVRVRLDPLQMREAVAELIDNALEAHEGSEPVEVVVQPDADRVRVLVRDRGPGLTEAARQHAFDPFFTTRRDHHGMGLCRARLIVEQHGGTIALSPRPGGGTDATIELALGGPGGET